MPVIYFTFESIFPYTHINLLKSKKNLFLCELFKRSKIHEYGLTIALEPFQASQYLMTWPLKFVPRWTIQHCNLFIVTILPVWIVGKGRRRRGTCGGRDSPPTSGAKFGSWPSATISIWLQVCTHTFTHTHLQLPVPVCQD